MVYKCQICGGQTTVDTKSGIAICDYCGTKQALPLFTEDSERLLYDRGNNYLLHSEYDKAENAFNQLLTIKPSAAELYWALVLCKYGVTYVKDPKTGKYIPTCNRTHYTPIFSDENYKKAIELASGEKKELFEEDAKTIDGIQKGIIAVSKKEKPFDIFISYKETDSNGNRTKDSIEAQKLYEKLTEAGYKVFFSRITLEDKIGTEYEPYIYAALYSSKVMLTICSSKENIEAVWVKNEWGRFLSLQQSDADKTLIPLYFDMDKSDLPDEFSMIPSFDIKEEGFEAELIRGIKKIIPLPIMLAQKRKKTIKVLKITAATLCVLIMAVTAVVLPKYMKAQKYEKQYAEAQHLFENTKYEDAFAAFCGLEDYKDSKEMAQKCMIQPDYDTAMKLYYDGYYAEAAWKFAELGDYEDALDMKKRAEVAWRKRLSTVVTRDIDVYSTGVYFINENGTVDTLDGTNGTAHLNLEIAKHGKIVSIGMAECLYALHEDGYVSNAKENNQLEDDSKWDNIIKISRKLTYTNIALRSDGTMVYGNTGPETGNDSWIKDISQWTDIVDFEIYTWGTYNEVDIGVIIGVKADGTLCAIAKPPHNISFWSIDFEKVNISSEVFINGGMEDIINQFQNVKELKFDFDYDYINERFTLNIVALTKNNKLITYYNGCFEEMDADDVCHVALNRDDETGEFETYVLKKKGEVVQLNNNKTVAYDVVYLQTGEYLITRTGTVCRKEYTLTEYEYIATKNKACVYQEWLTELD